MKRIESIESVESLDFKRGCKICVMGINGVGKSSLVQRIIRLSFNPHEESTIGASFHSLTHPTSFIKIDIWDTAGQERYSGLCKLYYRDAQIAIIVVAVGESVGDSVIEDDSINRAKIIIEEIITNSTNIKHFLIVINKLDVDETGMRHPMLEQQIHEYMKSLELGDTMTYSIVKTSAKKNTGIKCLKDNLFDVAEKYSIEREIKKPEINLKLDVPKKKKWFCC